MSSSVDDSDTYSENTGTDVDNGWTRIRTRDQGSLTWSDSDET